MDVTELSNKDVVAMHATNSSERIMYAVEGASLHKKGEGRREGEGCSLRRYE